MNIKISASIILIFIFSFNVYSRKLMLSRDYYKPIIDKQCWFKIQPLAQILKNNITVQCYKCLEKIPYNFKPFPPSNLYPHQGLCSDCFILNIPNGRAQGKEGNVFVNGLIIDEMIWQGLFQPLVIIPKISEDKIIKISGRVAVIAQPLYEYYFHWIQDILGRLALIEMHGIEYDYIYVPCAKKFMKEALELWGIDSTKIIIPDDENFCIQADELIVPSYVVNRNQGFNKYAGFHQNLLTTQYVSQKLIKAAQDRNIDTSRFCKRIFVSRKDAPKRKILNEDEIFKLFEAKGFISYELSKLSVAEQIMLFNQAEMVVGEHGAGMTNCLFCKSGTKVIEIFQELIDSGPWWITQVMGLNYSCIKTVKVDADYFAHFTLKAEIYTKAWKSNRYVSIEEVKKVIEKL
ncbi:glycosyltransferase family 61 protein [Candidatus Dependentiae bacterium]|nr:glycosyltransferase family 61 protein [Candidatus Dependentiae bacterium]